MISAVNHPQDITQLGSLLWFCALPPAAPIPPALPCPAQSHRLPDRLTWQSAIHSVYQSVDGINDRNKTERVLIQLFVSSRVLVECLH